MFFHSIIVALLSLHFSAGEVEKNLSSETTSSKINYGNIEEAIDFELDEVLEELDELKNSFMVEDVSTREQGEPNFSGIGDRLITGYPVLHSKPLTRNDAVNEGYTRESNLCIPNLGYPYYSYGRMRLYYSTMGQLSSISWDLYGSVDSNVLKQGYYDKIGEEHYRIYIGFRSDTYSICDENNEYEEPLGDVLIVQPHGVAIPIPLTESEASDANYVQGSCMHKMGTHYSFDFTTPDATLSWTADGKSPITPMYDRDGDIQSIYISSSNSHFALEGINLPASMYCRNYCDTECEYGAHFVTHLFFKDTDSDKVDCPTFPGFHKRFGLQYCKSFQTPDDGACLVDEDCASGFCSWNNLVNFICKPKSGRNAACVEHDDCMSNRCVAGGGRCWWPQWCCA